MCSGLRIQGLRSRVQALGLRDPALESERLLCSESRVQGSGFGGSGHLENGGTLMLRTECLQLRVQGWEERFRARASGLGVQELGFRVK